MEKCIWNGWTKNNWYSIYILYLLIPIYILATVDRDDSTYQVVYLLHWSTYGCDRYLRVTVPP